MKVSREEKREAGRETVKKKKEAKEEECRRERLKEGDTESIFVPTFI